MIFVLLDNYLTNIPKKIFFRTKYQLTGSCKRCGQCCKGIYLQISPNQIGSKLFRSLAIWWICWLFDFILIKIDYDNKYLVFTCKHVQKNGSCGNYFWRPNVCRNYPLVDYFKQPSFLPGCGYSAIINQDHAKT